MVNVWAAYEQDDPALSIRDFCIRYLAEHQSTPEPSGEDAWKSDRGGYLAALIGRMAKYAAFYSKKGLKQMELNNFEDVLFLMRIIQTGAPKKSEVIYDLLSEFPSGIDIIKRLLNLGLCEEFPDEHDRRSKRLKITEKGPQMMPQYYGVLSKVSQMATILLSAAEKELLIGLLAKLEYFHHEHYMAGRNDDFEVLYQRVTQPQT